MPQLRLSIYINVEYFIYNNASNSNEIATFDELFINDFSETSNVRTLIFYREELIFTLFNNSFNNGKF